MTVLRTAALAALLLVLSGPAFAKGAPQAWTRYVNARFGFSIEYPAGAFVPEPAPDNGDGRKFKAIRGRARFMVWAGHNVLDQSPKDFVAETLAACRQGSARYALTGKGLAVVSCEHKGEVLYAKRLFGKGRITSFQMTYPASERSRWDMPLSRMAESLKPAKRR